MWQHSPLDTSSLRWREGYIDAFPACDPASAPICIDWGEIADGTVYPYEFSYQQLEFLAGLRLGSGHDRGLAAAPTVERGALRCFGLTILFPEPVGWLQVLMGAADDSDPVELQLYRRGLPSLIEGRISGTAFVAPAADESGGENLEADTLQITTDSSAVLDIRPRGAKIVRICYRTRRQLDRKRSRISREALDATEAEPSGAPVLKPETLYRLQVETRAVVNHSGLEDTYRNGPRRFFFRTGSGPGLNSGGVAFGSGPLNQLETYVARSIPAHGARQHYYEYDIAVEFNEAYVERMYSQPLTLRIRDRNDRLAGAPEAHWGTGLMPLMPPGLVTFRASQETGGCAGPSPPTAGSPYLYRPAPGELAANRMYTVEVVSGSGYGAGALHSFEFATSRFASVEAHLTSGQIEGTQIVHSLPPGPALLLDWETAYSDLQVSLSEKRDQLTAAIAASALSIAETPIKRVTLSSCCMNSAPESSPSWTALSRRDLKRLGWGIVPLPSLLEFVKLPVDGGAAGSLLLESPEPLDWARLTLTSSAGPVLVLWNNDQTRAFIAGTGIEPLWAAGEPVDLSFTYSGGGFPEIPPLTRAGRFVSETVICTIRP